MGCVGERSVGVLRVRERINGLHTVNFKPKDVI